MKDFMDEYHAYMESCDEEASNTEITGSGCSTGCLTWVLVIIGILWLIGKITL